MDEEKIKTIHIETEKIVVDRDDELIDILNKVEGSKASKIILTFTEPTDILISPINLKVILDIADDNKKILVAQIIQNPSGVRNAKDSGMIVTEATGTILDDYWVDAERTFKSRMKFKEDRLFNKKNTNRDEVKQIKNEDIEEERIELYEPLVETLEPKEKSEFEKIVDQVLQKSQDGINNKGTKIVEKNGLVIALDSDITQEETERGNHNGHNMVNKEDIDNHARQTSNIHPSLIGKDMGSFRQESDIEDMGEDQVNNESNNNSRVKRRRPVANPFPELLNRLKNFVIPSKKGAKNIATILLRISIPIVLLLAVVGFLVYEFLPLVRVTIFVESKKISLEKDFTGTVGTKDYSYEDGLIPVKSEEIKKDSSGNTTPTGTAFRGNKAEGVVTLKFWGISPSKPNATVPAGTKITSSGGLVFVTISNAVVGDSSSFTKDVGVQASDLGTDYNLPSGNTFTVGGFAATEMTATNDAAFSGGSREQYTVLSKKDVQKVVDSLKKTAFEDSKSELQSRTDGGWELIDSTLKQDQVGDAKTDIPIGGEGSVVNVTITTKSSGIYYQRNNIDDKISEVLSKAAQEQNLFNNSNGVTLQLSDNIQKDIKVTSVKNNTVKIKLTASGIIKPQVNKENIIKDLGGKQWKDGLEVLKKYTYSSKEANVEFTPSYFPDFLKYFPSLQGKILLITQDI